MTRLANLSRRERIIALFTVSVIAAGALYVFAIEPIVEEWTAARASAHVLDEERNTLRSLMAHRDEIESGFAAMKDAIAEGSAWEELQLDFVRGVEDLAQRQGLQITNIRPLGHSEEVPFRRLAVQITAEGEHHEFVHFLHAMQRPGTLFRGDAITVIASRRTPPLTITLKISKLVRIRRT